MTPRTTYLSAHREDFRQADVMISMDVTGKDTLNITKDLPYTGLVFWIVTVEPNKLSPSSFTAVEQDSAVIRDPNQGRRHYINASMNL